MPQGLIKREEYQRLLDHWKSVDLETFILSYTNYSGIVRRQAHGVLICCPFPNHDDRSPSFSIRKDGRWRCFGACGSGGDIFDFVGHMRGLNPNQPADMAAILENLEGVVQRVEVKKTVQKPIERKVIPYKTVLNRYNSIGLAMPYLNGERRIAEPVLHGALAGYEVDFRTCYDYLDGRTQWFRSRRACIPSVFYQQVRSTQLRRHDEWCYQQVEKDFGSDGPARQVYKDLCERARRKERDPETVLLGDVVDAMYGVKYRQDTGSVNNIFGAWLLGKIENNRFRYYRYDAAIIAPERKEIDVLSWWTAGYMALGIRIERDVTPAVARAALQGVHRRIIVRDPDATGEATANLLYKAITTNDNGEIVPELVARTEYMTLPEGYKDCNQILVAEGIQMVDQVAGSYLDPVLRHRVWA